MSVNQVQTEESPYIGMEFASLPAKEVQEPVNQRIQRVRGKTKSRIIEIPCTPPTPLPHEVMLEKPKLDETPSTIGSMQNIISRGEQFSKEEKKLMAAMVEKAEKKAIQNLLRLREKDRAIEKAQKAQDSSDRIGRYVEHAQVAIAITTGIALFTVGSPLATMGGLLLFVTGSTSLVGRIISASPYKSPTSDALGNVCGKLALLGSAPAYAAIPRDDRPSFIQVGILLFNLAASIPQAVTAANRRALKQRQQEATDVKHNFERAKAAGENSKIALNEIHRSQLHNMLMVVQALKEELDSIKRVNIFRG